MTIEDQILRSRTLIEKSWSIVAKNCPDQRLCGSFLHPVEGLQGHRSLDLDRRYHIDSWAIAGGAWTPLSTRYQDSCFADYNTITLRGTEVRHLVSTIGQTEQFAAALHVQMYGTADDLELVIIAELAPVIEYLAEVKDRLYWQKAYDGTPFVALSCGQLEALNALIWKCRPHKPEQLEML